MQLLEYALFGVTLTHYVTFDNGNHNFQGDCEYTLVRPCTDRTDLVDFHLWGDNVKNNPSERVSYLAEDCAWGERHQHCHHKEPWDPCERSQEDSSH